jgi:NSS family neurotransmitter:Na+ symporter
MGSRETWATRLGFILAAIGSAVGLGNIWRFPFITAESGGAAFLVVYLLLVAFIGLPVMLVEFVIGRESKQNVVDAFPTIGYDSWKLVGMLGSLTGFIILSYYSVVGGWVIQYLLGSLTGAYTGSAEAYFGQVSSGLNTVGFDLLFIVLVAGVVGFGVRNGLERAAKLLVPSVVGLMVFLAVYAATLPGAAAGYAYYLAPNLATLRSDAIAILPAAAGQAFFTLSTGVGVMITYGSYLDEDRSLLRDGFVIMVADTCIAVLAGLIVFPVFFAQGVAPGDGGIGATFISLAGAFTTLPGGRFVGAAFFIILLLAALTSAFSILEVIVSFLIDTTGITRSAATAGSVTAIFVVGLPTAFDLQYLTVYDAIANNVLLLLGGLLLALFGGWVYASDAISEFTKGLAAPEFVPRLWIWVLRVPVVVVLSYVLYRNIIDVIQTIQTSLL